MAEELPSLEQWLQQMSGRQLPAFARTAQRIASRSTDSSSSTGDLAALILQDMSMTTRLLRMANSVLFNPGGGRIGTISRAIIVLGFDTVRDLCLSIAVIDGLLSGPNRHLVARGMGLALHAALQARQLAKMARLADVEEVFVATLLSHLGGLALMCLGGEEHPQLIARLARLSGMPAAQRTAAEIELLGFPLRELTAGLNREWRLSSLLTRALDPQAATEPRLQALQFGNALAECLLGGAEGESLESLIDQAGRALRLTPSALRQGVEEARRSAVEASRSLGAEISPGETAQPPAEVAAPRFHPGDMSVQMAALREISQLLVEQRPSLSALMELVLEGLFRGVGLDRVVFALLDGERRKLRQRALLAVEGSTPEVVFEFAAKPASANALAWSLARDEALWVGGPQSEAPPADPALAKLSSGHCLIMPLVVAGTPIGCLYGDRAASGRPLSEELFAQFRLFGQQARLGLTVIRSRPA